MLERGQGRREPDESLKSVRFWPLSAASPRVDQLTEHPQGVIGVWVVLQIKNDRGETAVYVGVPRMVCGEISKNDPALRPVVRTAKQPAWRKPGKRNRVGAIFSELGGDRVESGRPSSIWAPPLPSCAATAILRATTRGPRLPC